MRLLTVEIVCSRLWVRELRYSSTVSALEDTIQRLYPSGKANEGLAVWETYFDVARPEGFEVSRSVKRCHHTHTGNRHIEGHLPDNGNARPNKGKHSSINSDRGV